jgi:hypothetical protein
VLTTHKDIGNTRNNSCSKPSPPSRTKANVSYEPGLEQSREGLSFSSNCSSMHTSAPLAWFLAPLRGLPQTHLRRLKPHRYNPCSEYPLIFKEDIRRCCSDTVRTHAWIHREVKRPRARLRECHQPFRGKRNSTSQCQSPSHYYLNNHHLCGIS